MSPLLSNFGNFFGVDGIVILAIGLLIFGRRLPEVGGNMWQTLRQAFDPQADPMRKLELVLVLVVALVILAIALTYRTQ